MNEILKKIDKHKGTILTVAGAAGCVGSVVLAVKATPKALAAIDNAEKEKFANTGSYNLTIGETVKTGWKYYILTGVTLFGSIAMIAGGKYFDYQTHQVSITAYNMLARQAALYEQKVIEQFGEKGHKEVIREVEQEQLKQNPITDETVIYDTGKGTSLCYDDGTGRYFRTSADYIQKAENEINFNLRSCMFISVNDLYMSLGLEGTYFGDLLGWNVDDGPISLWIGDSFTASNGEPCLIMRYSTQPHEDYQKLS